MPHLPNFDIVRLLTSLGLARATDGKLIPSPMVVSAKTADYVIKPSDPCGTLFTNRGAVGAIVFTLPAPTAVPSGTWYHFLGIADQTITVATATVDTLIGFNDLDLDSVGIATAGDLIGVLLKLVTDGTSWIAIGETVGAVYVLTD
jgi:hypothetical protein